MKFSRLSLPWLITASLLCLLVALASFQYRWLGEVSQAQRETMRSRLNRDVRLFAREFDRELTRIVALSQVMTSADQEVGGEQFAAFFETWNRLALFPDLVRDVFFVRGENGRGENGRGENGRGENGRGENGRGENRRGERGNDSELHLFSWDAATFEVLDRPWPADLTNLKTRLEERPFRMGPGDERPWNVLDVELPAIVVPLFQNRMRRRGSGSRGGGSRGPGTRGPGSRGPGPPPMPRVESYLVFRLQPKEMLERLSQNHFGDDGQLDFHVKIVEEQDPKRVVFEAGPPIQGRGRAGGDASGELFGFLHAEHARQLMAELPSMLPSSPEMRRERFLLFELGHLFGHQWRLAVTHPSGSLEAMVSSTRRRNLAISLGILGVLGVAVVFLVVVTRRAEALARQQIEFVAGVTHELRTPLAAMRSAGENLADGVVRDPSQVARYGQLISNEGRRLSNMVEQVLEYAGIQSGHRLYQPTLTGVREIIEGAVAENRAWIDEKGFEVEVDIADDMPEVLVDPAALCRALSNLIGNAIKYGEQGAWIGVRARRPGNEVCIRVEDRGQGIATEDLPHLFEPFYRGRDLSAGRIPGSGLGLSLVRQICEAQGGRVSVASQPGEGSVFTIHLPGRPPGKFQEVS